MHIFIVDDEENIRYVVKYNLELDGHEVTAAKNGNEALEMLSQMETKPDVLLLDVMMPGISGLDVCKRVKEEETLKDLPIIMLTAKSQLVDIEDAFRAGADDYLTKPFEPDEISKKVEKKYDNIMKARS